MQNDMKNSIILQFELVSSLLCCFFSGSTSHLLAGSTSYSNGRQSTSEVCCHSQFLHVFCSILPYFRTFTGWLKPTCSTCKTLKTLAFIKSMLKYAMILNLPMVI